MKAILKHGQYVQLIKSSQQTFCPLASLLLRITSDSDAFISVSSEFRNIPPPTYENDPL